MYVFPPQSDVGEHSVVFTCTSTTSVAWDSMNQQGCAYTHRVGLQSSSKWQRKKHLLQHLTISVCYQTPTSIQTERILLHGRTLEITWGSTTLASMAAYCWGAVGISPQLGRCFTLHYVQGNAVSSSLILIPVLISI